MDRFCSGMACGSWECWLCPAQLGTTACGPLSSRSQRCELLERLSHLVMSIALGPMLQGLALLLSDCWPPQQAGRASCTHLKLYPCNHLQVTILGRHEQDELLLLASDGLWDVLSNQVWGSSHPCLWSPCHLRYSHCGPHSGSACDVLHGACCLMIHYVGSIQLLQPFASASHRRRARWQSGACGGPGSGGRAATAPPASRRPC